MPQVVSASNPARFCRGAYLHVLRAHLLPRRVPYFRPSLSRHRRETKPSHLLRLTTPPPPPPPLFGRCFLGPQSTMTSSQSRSQSQPSLEDLQSNTMIAVSAVFLTFASIAVALRVYVRAVMIRSFGWDDRLMLLTLVYTPSFWLCSRSLLIHVRRSSLPVVPF